jgi:superfamily II DNA or RNA helicase
MYNEETKELRIPRGIDINYVEKLFNTTASIDYTPDEYETMSIKVKTLPRDDVQRKSISFLIGEGDFKYTSKYSQLLLNLPTGTGKTYVATTSLQFIGMKAIIITPTDKIKQQWYETFLNMTDISDQHICDISGSNVIKQLLRSKTNKFKVYIVNHGTIASYAKSNGWDAVHELFKHLRVGVKMYDEAHLNFANTIKIDLNTNTKKTFYITATFERSDYKENYLFNTCFRSAIKYGYETREELRKHIMYLSILYNSKPDLGVQGHMTTRMGFNKNRYSEYQESCPEFYDALKYALDFFKTKEGKILILSTKISQVDKIRSFVKEYIPDKTVSAYHSKADPEEKAKALDADIICSTPKSAGTGTDINGLRTTIMCEAYSSAVQADQTPGRLREYSEHDNTFYVELVDVGFQKVYKMYRSRLSVFKKKCLKLLSVDLTKK